MTLYVYLLNQTRDCGSRTADVSGIKANFNGLAFVRDGACTSSSLAPRTRSGMGGRTTREVMPVDVLIHVILTSLVGG
jgi:hypothetical protein